ncbi:hypothetical protein A1Q1_02677 [Trichosporon asahii var. asahii CBS 2479]|uniref:BRCT domain-containing protein n=1 Tax=Trichosporon asahii var. asahii (strain ATCC 90039 / CBS 2479 / JCM 2466 / KCTC 7840 / NBRC 103889/ NCYC 2677 / UAMH 7654) TaxID=1186058 RepID=J6EUX1_TRIAS|nr:hypothetical protein A1Q1_02677 [Trichosporon asahii var. asahii CBS 2479]EJT48394.1 hypothetical protein A1Q1_02677 [Trichosporon asahii var. asahii CBS 2479]
MSGILSEDVLCFAEDQFSGDELELLTDLAEGRLWRIPRPPMPFSSPSRTPPPIPFPMCRLLHITGWVNPNELDLPFFVSQPSEGNPDSRPLRFWVSINVKRDRAEPAEIAQACIQAKLRRHGGLIVSKRSQADVLVVNRETEFYRTVKKEIADKGRHWQTTAEKEWVDACIAGRELLSATDVDLGLKTQRSPSVESVTSEEDVRIGKGPGRPVGRPRNEYTPHDDDFLCRFLAAYYPHGSHGSRKTYQDLGAELFTTAAHHTAQSWHERFKKNKAIMSRRIARFQADGIGLDLRTDVERERDKETKRRLAQQKMQAQTQPSTSSQASPKNARRAFVELDDSDDADRPATKRQKASTQTATQLALGRGRAAVLGARPSLGQAGPSQQARRSTTPERPQPSTSPSRLQPTGETAAISQGSKQSTSASGREPPEPARGQPDTEESTQDSAFSRANVSADIALAPPEEEDGSDGDEQPAASAAVARVEVGEIEATTQQVPSAGQDPASSGDNAGQKAVQNVTASVSQPPSAQHTPRTAPASRPHSPAAIVPSPSSKQPGPSQPGPSSTPASPRSHDLLNAPRTSTPGSSRNGSRNASPASTPSQRVARGAALVTTARETFKRNIMAYSEKYGCTPTELYTIVNGLGRKGAGKGGQMYWDDVERGLRDKFGY